MLQPPPESSLGSLTPPHKKREEGVKCQSWCQSPSVQPFSWAFSFPWWLGPCASNAFSEGGKKSRCLSLGARHSYGCTVFALHLATPPPDPGCGWTLMPSPWAWPPSSSAHAQLLTLCPASLLCPALLHFIPRPGASPSWIFVPYSVPYSSSLLTLSLSSSSLA